MRWTALGLVPDLLCVGFTAAAHRSGCHRGHSCLTPASVGSLSLWSAAVGVAVEADAEARVIPEPPPADETSPL